MPRQGHARGAIGRVALCLSLLQLGLHVAAAAGARDPRLAAPHVVAWLHDVLLLCATATLFAGLGRLGAAWVGGVADAFGLGALTIEGALLATYPPMLPSFLAAPANFLQADLAAASVFVQDYAGAGALWPAALALGVGLAAPRLRFVRVGRRWAFAAAPLLILGMIALGRESPNPVVFALQDSARQLLVPRAVRRIRTAAPSTGARLPATTVDWTPAGAAAYDRVILAVLEGVTAREFEAGFLALRDGFAERHRAHAHWFSRYHATNLDSYTSLIAMTTSIQVPFRAYAAPERYEAVNEAPNLVDGLRAAGFATLFVSTYEHQPFVPNARHWDRTLDRRSLGDLSAWVSLGSNRMEQATEDRAALPAILDFMKSSPRALVLAELVFGHSPEWRAKTGLTPVEHYDHYLTDLWDRLEQANLAARTLLVVVSDHGDRSQPAAPDNYRVPLLVVGEGVTPGADGEFRSHLDLQRIVAHFFTGSALPPPRQAVTVVGSTERWVYGEIREDGQHVFVDDNSGRVMAGALDAAAARESFQSYVGAFTASCPPIQGRVAGHSGPP